MKQDVRVVSLERSIERRATFAANNPELAFTFFDAVDGSQVVHQVANEPDLFEPGLPYSAGAYGCALSHLTLWQEAAETERVLTVLEDDAIVRADFAEASAAFIAALPEDWDLVVWAWNFDSILSLNVMPGVSPAVMLFDQNALRAGLDTFRASTGMPAALRLDKCFGTPAYSISPRGARRFMAGCFPLSNFRLFFPVLNGELPNNGIDIAMNRIYASTNSYCAFPPLAATPNERAISTVQV